MQNDVEKSEIGQVKNQLKTFLNYWKIRKIDFIFRKFTGFFQSGVLDSKNNGRRMKFSQHVVNDLYFTYPLRKSIFLFFFMLFKDVFEYQSDSTSGEVESDHLSEF